MRIFFTGPREGMFEKQYRSLHDLLARLKTPWGDTFAHGDCVGCDEEAHRLAEALGYDIDIRPPKNPSLRAFLTPVRGTMYEPTGYIERNRAGVEWCDVLISTPRFPEERRSGTWSTIRYAGQLRKNRVLIGHRGEVWGAGDRIRW